MMSDVSKIALKDISQWFRDNDIYNKNKGFGVVGQELLQTKETRYLNRLLGLRGVNHIGNENWKSNPKFKGNIKP